MSAETRDQAPLDLSANCMETLRHLWDYLDDQMTPAGAERLRAHIATCESCSRYEDFQERFLAKVSQIRADLGAPASLREKLAEKLREQGCGCWGKALKGVTE